MSGGKRVRGIAKLTVVMLPHATWGEEEPTSRRSRSSAVAPTRPSMPPTERYLGALLADAMAANMMAERENRMMWFAVGAEVLMNASGVMRS